MLHSRAVASYSVDLDSRCLGCDRRRWPTDTDARLVAQGDTTTYLMAEPCECGERRIRVRLRFNGSETEEDGSADEADR